VRRDSWITINETGQSAAGLDSRSLIHNLGASSSQGGGVVGPSSSAGSKKAFFLLGLLACLSPTALGGVSRDAYVHRKGDTWTLGTLKVQRTVGLQAGPFVTSSWKNKVNGRELIPAGTLSEELRVGVDGHEVSGTEGDWQLVGAQGHILAQGEIQLDITLRRKSLEATKSFVVYPGSSIIREGLASRMWVAKS
jgi:hypothetical protein